MNLVKAVVILLASFGLSAVASAETNVQINGPVGNVNVVKGHHHHAVVYPAVVAPVVYPVVVGYPAVAYPATTVIVH